MSYFSPPLDFYLQIRKGRIPGHSSATLLGECETVGTTEETIWCDEGLLLWPSSATQMTVSSESVDDDQGGAGATSLMIEGLDSNFNLLTETVVLDGQTGVTTANSYYRINKAQVITVGSAGSNQGKIYIGTGTITAGRPATVYEAVCLNKNISHSGRFTVPAGSSRFQTLAAVTTSAPIVFTQYMRSPGGIFYAGGSAFNNGVFVVESQVSEKLVTGADYEIRAKTITGTALVYVYIEFLVVDDRAG